MKAILGVCLLSILAAAFILGSRGTAYEQFATWRGDQPFPQQIALMESESVRSAAMVPLQAISDPVPAVDGVSELAIGDHSATPKDNPLAQHYAYIVAAQSREGAISFNLDHNYVNPYFGNLAARALLTDPDYLRTVERHMDWYVANLNANGTIDDFVRRNGELKPTGGYDSADSYAATFLTVVDRYLEAGGDPGWVVRNREQLDLIEQMLISLTDQDGLTWAKPMYWLKFLMDNSEVYAGWLDWADVLERVGEPDKAEAARSRAADVQQGLERFRQNDGLWAWGLDRLGIQRRSKPGRFYPDGVAQLFPGAWGLTDGSEAFVWFDHAYPEWSGLQEGDFPWTFPVYVAAQGGRSDRFPEVEAAISEQYPNLEPRWFVTESAWIILAGVGR